MHSWFGVFLLDTDPIFHAGYACAMCTVGDDAWSQQEGNGPVDLRQRSRRKLGHNVQFRAPLVSFEVTTASRSLKIEISDLNYVHMFLASTDSISLMKHGMWRIMIPWPAYSAADKKHSRIALNFTPLFEPYLHGLLRVLHPSTQNLGCMRGNWCRILVNAFRILRISRTKQFNSKFTHCTNQG